MPVVDLPADSLGPKPTKKQMELLKRMAAPGATVRMWVGGFGAKLQSTAVTVPATGLPLVSLITPERVTPGVAGICAVCLC